MSWGRHGNWPFKFGGTQNKPTKVEYRALLAALEPAYDSTVGTVHEVEMFAHARVPGMIWGAGKRLANQALPEKMLEALPVWEEILQLTPLPGTSDFARRAAVGAKLRGLQNNAMPDIEAVAQKIMGQNLSAVLTVDPAANWSYYPGGTPGPSSMPWASAMAIIGFRVNKNGLTDSAFFLKVAQLREAMQDLLPAWMWFTIGTGSGFTVGVSIVGEAYI